MEDWVITLIDSADKLKELMRKVITLLLLHGLVLTLLLLSLFQLCLLILPLQVLLRNQVGESSKQGIQAS